MFAQADCELLYADLNAAVCTELTGVVISHAESASQISEADSLISRLEEERGIVPGTVEMVVALDTAKADQEAQQIACYTVNTSTGELPATGIVPSEPRPNALGPDLQDKFLFSAGQNAGRMASFGVNSDWGKLTALETYPLGNGPCWVSIMELPG